MKCCPACGQQVDRLRYGVKLGKVKVRIFDAIERQPGISQKELSEKVYETSMDKSTISVHVIQINELFCHTDLKIVGKQYSGYRMVVPRGMKR